MENVVLLDETGHALGVAAKAEVHHENTPLHLAFSCYVFNSAGEFLLTRRALTKHVFPGVWTNTCCGHPAPQEALPDAVRRRLKQELGLGVSQITLVLPGFRYRAMMNGVLENEMCPVYAAHADADPVPAPAEVDAFEWADWGRFSADVLAGRREVSPWCVQQVTELAGLAWPWPAGDPASLPPAARYTVP